MPLQNLDYLEVGYYKTDYYPLPNYFISKRIIFCILTLEKPIVMKIQENLKFEIEESIVNFFQGQNPDLLRISEA